MKMTVLLVLFISANLWAQTKITKLNYDEQGRMIRMAPGFDDSSFYYKNIEQTKRVRFCFSGDANNVCQLIKDFANTKMNNYSAGDHDYLEINECIVNEKEVNLSYNLIDDYGTDYSVSKRIENCTKVFLEE